MMKRAPQGRRGPVHRPPMNLELDGGYLLERLLSWLLLLGLVAGSAFVFLGTLGLTNLHIWTPFGQNLDRMLGLTQDPTGGQHVTVGALSLFAGLLLSGLAVRRLFGSGTSEQRHILSADEQGMVVVEDRGISAVAEAAVHRLPGVVGCRVQVAGKGAAPIRLKVVLWASAAAELKALGDEARARAALAVEQLVGLKVHSVLLRVEVVALDEVRRILE